MSEVTRCPNDKCQAFAMVKMKADGHYRCEMCGTIVILPGGE